MEEEEEKVGVRDLYSNMTEDIRFAKRQQWTVGYFLILVHAALAGLYNLLAAANPEMGETPKFLIFLVAGSSTLAGVWYLASCQVWIRDSRKTLGRIYRDHASEGFVEARGGREIGISFSRHPTVLFTLVFSANTSGALLAWYIFQDLVFAAKIFGLGFVLSGLILLWHKTSHKG